MGFIQRAVLLATMRHFPKNSIHSARALNRRWWRNVPLPRHSRVRLCQRLRINPQNATDPDAVAGRLLRTCAGPLAAVFTDLFILSLLHTQVPTCFNKTIIIPMLKKNKEPCLNDYHEVALTSTIFKRLVMEYFNSMLQPALIHCSWLTNATNPQHTPSPWL